MKINKENIECFIFDYHEGNLSDAEKAEVLNFIHQYPEYENDFTHWAQSYFLAEKSIKNYGIAEGLLQKQPVLWYTRPWVTISSGFVLAGIGLYSYMLLNTKKTNTSPVYADTMIVTEKQLERNERIKSATPVSIPQQTDDKRNHSLIMLKNGIPLTGTASQKNSDASVTDTLAKSDHAYTQVSNPIQKNSIAKTDTLDNTIPSNTKEEIKAKKTPSKHKSGLRLKPENKFIPTNPDF